MRYTFDLACPRDLDAGRGQTSDKEVLLLSALLPTIGAQIPAQRV